MGRQRMAGWQRTVLALLVAVVGGVIAAYGVTSHGAAPRAASVTFPAATTAGQPMSDSVVQPVTSSATTTPPVDVGNFVGDFYTQVSVEAPPAGTPPLRFVYRWGALEPGSVDSVVVAQNPPAQTLVPAGSVVTLTMGSSR